MFNHLIFLHTHPLQFYMHQLVFPTLVCSFAWNFQLILYIPYTDMDIFYKLFSYRGALKV